MIYTYITLGLTALAGAIALLIKKFKDESSSVDGVKFSSLIWTYGGASGNGQTSVLSTPRISNLQVNSTKDMTLTWDVGMTDWGYGNTDAKGIACLFCKVGNQWVGGKFEYISTSRSYRAFTNISKKYSGWDPSNLNASEFAFVVISSDLKSRSNVIYYKR